MNLLTSFEGVWKKLKSAKLWLAVALLWIICGIDYQVLEDVFRDGKYRYMLFSLVPVAYIFFKKHLHWAPALFAAMMLFQWTLRGYSMFGTFKIILVFATLAFASVLSKLNPYEFGRMLILPGALQAALAITQKFGLQLLWTPNESWALNMASGSMGHETILGPMLICCLPPALWYGYAFRHKFTAAIMVLAIILTGSSMSIAALASVLLIYLWQKTSFKTAFVAGALLSSSLVIAYFIPGAHVENHDLFSLTGRGPVWVSAWKAFQHHWFFGGGPGYWMGVWMPEHLGPVGNHVALQVHCDPLELLVDYGLVTALPLVYALWKFAKDFTPTWYHAVSVGILVNSLGNFPMQIVPIALIFLVAWSFSNREYTPFKDDRRHVYS